MMFFHELRSTLPIDETTQRIIDEQYSSPPPAYNSSVIEILEMIAQFELKDQVQMLANMLTLSGYTQREIAEVLGMGYRDYRMNLKKTRDILRYNGPKSL